MRMRNIWNRCEMLASFRSENLQERGHLKKKNNSVVGGNIVLKWVLKKYVSVWTGFIWGEKGGHF